MASFFPTPYPPDPPPVTHSVTAAWLGDSRAVLGLHSVRGVHRIQALTQDHKPEDPREMARIVRSGGRVVQVYHDAHNNPVGGC